MNITIFDRYINYKVTNHAKSPFLIGISTINIYKWQCLIVYSTHMLHVWYIQLHNWVIFRANVSKYSSTLEHMGNDMNSIWRYLENHRGWCPPVSSLSTIVSHIDYSFESTMNLSYVTEIRQIRYLGGSIVQLCATTKKATLLRSHWNDA